MNEPDSVWDANALMVFHIEKWHIIGYQQYLHKFWYEIQLLNVFLQSTEIINITVIYDDDNVLYPLHIV